MKFRNYLPHDEQLRGGKLAPVSLPKFEDPISAEDAEPKQVEVLSWCPQISRCLYF
jgi:coiled-coil domain-containing protein 12